MVINIFKFITDKRVKRLKSILKRKLQEIELFEREYVKERNKRIELESVILNEYEKEYIKQLIQTDRIINSNKHSSFGLYSEFNTDLFGFTGNILDKISKM